MLEKTKSSVLSPLVGKYTLGKEQLGLLTMFMISFWLVIDGSKIAGSYIIALQ